MKTRWPPPRPQPAPLPDTSDPAPLTLRQVAALAALAFLCWAIAGALFVRWLEGTP